MAQHPVLHDFPSFGTEDISALPTQVQEAVRHLKAARTYLSWRFSLQANAREAQANLDARIILLRAYTEVLSESSPVCDGELIEGLVRGVEAVSPLRITEVPEAPKPQLVRPGPALRLVQEQPREWKLVPLGYIDICSFPQGCITQTEFGLTTEESAEVKPMCAGHAHVLLSKWMEGK